MSYLLINTACLSDVEWLIFIIGEEQVVFYPAVQEYGKYITFCFGFLKEYRIYMLANNDCQTEFGAQYI